MPTATTAGAVIDTGSRSIARLRLLNGNLVDFVSFEPEVLTMEVHRRIATIQNGVVSHSWLKIAEANMNTNEMYVFHSNLPAIYRGRVTSPADGGIVEHYTIAVAYTKTPGKSAS